MKIVRGNAIDLGKISDRRRFRSVDEAISKVGNIDLASIQWSQGELDGVVLDCEMQPLMEAVHVAYTDHLPLVLTPDAVWYCIANAFAVYINANSEEMRAVLVSHQGKKRIQVIRDEFVFGAKNPWNEVIDEFSDKIKEQTNNGIVDRLQADFTTTSKIARIASQIVVMDAVQNFFQYYLKTRCGVPEIRIAGEKRDWERIKHRANGLLELIPKFKEWIDQLNEILDEFINVFDDKVNEEFWNRIYKFSMQSGGPFIGGWIICLFPYLKNREENPRVWKHSAQEVNIRGLRTNDFAHQLNKVPFIWNYLGTEYDMQFIGGLVGVSCSKLDYALTPIFGYAVAFEKPTQA